MKSLKFSKTVEAIIVLVTILFASSNVYAEINHSKINFSGRVVLSPCPVNAGKERGDKVVEDLSGQCLSYKKTSVQPVFSYSSLTNNQEVAGHIITISYD